MLLGILSDSHGRADTTRRAMKLLVESGAELFIHLGDVGSESVLDELIGLNTRIVFGNCDDDIPNLTRYAEVMGIGVNHPIGMLDIGDKSIAFTHGHLPDLMKKALDDRVNYLLHGHTHELLDHQVGGTRVINPGALCRAARYTVAILDPVADHLKVIDVGKG